MNVVREDTHETDHIDVPSSTQIRSKTKLTTETPLTCYICGETSEEWIAVDMIRLFRDQAAARDRFEEKHGREPESDLFVCPDCEAENPYTDSRRIPAPLGAG